MKIIVLTLFKEMFEPFVSTSIIKRAIEKKIVSIRTIDIRDFTEDKHNRVDFPPYGGGSGMIMSAEPLAKAIDYSLDLLKDDEKDVVAWKEYLNNVLKKRGSEWRGLYNACKEINA